MMRMPKPLFLAVLLALFELAACGASQPGYGGGPSLRSGMGRGRARSVRARLIEAQKEVRRLEEELASRDAAVAEAQQQAESAQRSEEQLRSELAATRSEVESLRGELAEVRAAAGAGGEATGAAGGAEVARLESELSSERTRRIEAEDQLSRLRQETSAGPYERAAETAPALAEAQQQIAELTATLADERQQRADLERRYDALQTQIDTAPAAAAAPAEADADMVELQEQQRRVMAAIQQDLEASRRREDALRGQLAAAQGPDATGLSEQVMGLRAENQALQSTLDAEHRTNRELAAKLEVATRVADLIFKMRAEGQPIATDILEEANQ